MVHHKGTKDTKKKKKDGGAVDMRDRRMNAPSARARHLPLCSFVSFVPLW